MADTVWIARHGNRQDFVNPDWLSSAPRPFDPDLSEDGAIQAQRLGQRMAEEGIDRIFASPFLRTVQTAHHVAEATGLPIHIEPMLCEWLNAEWFAEMPKLLPLPELASLFPEIDLRYKPLGLPAYPETADEAFMRCGEAARQLAERYDGRILLVGHGVSVSGAAHGLVNGLAPFEVALCSVVKIQRDEGAWLAALCGDVSHLDEAIGADRLN